MKKTLLACAFTCFTTLHALSQCSVGYSSCSLNWDYLAFLPSAGIGSYTTLAQSQTQRFAFGTQQLTLKHTFTGSGALGTDATNTAATGNDAHFVGNGQVNGTFANGVYNISFSVYDIDASQRLTVSSTAAIVTMAKVSGTVLTVAGSGTASANAKATNTTVGNSSTDGTVNVTITSLVPVTDFSIAVTQSSGTSDDFWIGDISACSAGTFTANYFHVSKPYTNQPGYVLAAAGNRVLYVDPATGQSKVLFTDATATNINSLAYDPVKHYVYYVLDGTGAGGAANPANKKIRRYHYDADTLGTVINDITAFVPTFDMGVEIGGAAFYDGSLYFGVDIGTGNVYKGVIWRFDFDNANNPVSASQVFGIDAANHDWGDFGVVNGMLYNFDAQTGAENYHHQNLYSKAVTVYTPTGANVPKQTAVDWNGTLYSLGDATTPAPANGVIVPYTMTGTLTTASQKTITVGGTAVTAQWRDAGEAFKPKVDFGDAPATYDPVGSNPAMHETSPGLYLGSNSSIEWVTRGQTVFANSDNFDDGLAIGSLVNPVAGSFFAQVQYFNNTGAPATICAWVDFNNNGVFDPGEGKVQSNLPSSASPQSVFINWNGVTTSLTNGQFTYLRVRITPAANNMTTSNPTGFFNGGEVEDYRLVVTMNALDGNLLSFDAVKDASTRALLTWQVVNEESRTAYTLQRSADARRWYDVTTQEAVSSVAAKTYRYTDPTPLHGTVYYRLKMSLDGHATFSNVRMLAQVAGSSFRLLPNPASTAVSVEADIQAHGVVTVEIYDAAGRKVLSENIQAVAGSNRFTVDVSTLKKGAYWLRLTQNSSTAVQKLHINR